jgi:hypothetical protein
MRRTLVCALAAGAVLAMLTLAACNPAEQSPDQSPTPAPAGTPVVGLQSVTPAPASSTPGEVPTPPEASPTPLYVPDKQMDTGKLFNGIQYQETLTTGSGSGPSNAELSQPGDYSVHVDVDVKIPTAASTVDDLTALNPSLTTLFPNLAQWVGAAKVSPLFERLYRHKINYLKQNLARLDALMPRHDFYDCETMLEITPPGTKRKILWIQSDMDVDSDGSDADRVPAVDGNSLTFQPITSYKWPKRGEAPNPFIPEREARLSMLQEKAATATTPAQKSQIADAIEEVQWELKQLKTNSFLVAADDPYVVIPSSVLSQRDDQYSPAIGDYCAVIYQNQIYPAIIGDAGPTSKVGEASLRIAQQLNPLATSENRPVSSLKITYLIFPNTAEKPFTPPDLTHWHEKVDNLLKEAGGYNGELFTWQDLTAPTPTPTPEPTPESTGTTTLSGTITTTGTASPSETATPPMPATTGTSSGT